MVDSPTTGMNYIGESTNGESNHRRVTSASLTIAELTRRRVDPSASRQSASRRRRVELAEIGERGSGDVKGATIELLNNVRYDLVVNFTSNAWRNVHDRTEDLLEEWTRLKLFEENTFAKGNELYMMEQIYDFTK
uniref:Uncharacterized protein n=1 Tax=Globodera rostochiensis TaxID=31243 RepID=A0A914IDY9_GLORO